MLSKTVVDVNTTGNGEEKQEYRPGDLCRKCLSLNYIRNAMPCKKIDRIQNQSFNFGRQTDRQSYWFPYEFLEKNRSDLKTLNISFTNYYIMPAIKLQFVPSVSKDSLLRELKQKLNSVNKKKSNN